MENENYSSKFKENIPNNIGRIIEEKWKESGLSMTEFALLIGKVRTDVNYIFTLESIHIDILIKISKALNYDFIHNVYYEDYKEEEQTSLTIPPITLKIKENEIIGINLPKEFIRLIKAEK